MSGSHYKRLTKLLAAKPFLIADGEAAEARLVTEKAAHAAITAANNKLFHAQAVLHVGNTLPRFAKLVGEDDREFDLEEMAKIAGVTNRILQNWMMDDIVPATVRPAAGPGRGKGAKFSWADAFMVGILGALRRQGIGLDTLKKVRFLFEKRATQRAATRARP